MANYMNEVAKILGVELLEEFEIVFPNNPSCHATALLNSEKLYIKDHNLANQDFWQISALTNLLNGTYMVKRKPWKPMYDELYYFIDEKGEIYTDTWDDTCFDIIFYKTGNCYKTCEEAEKNKDKWLKFYRSEEVLEV